MLTDVFRTIFQDIIIFDLRGDLIMVSTGIVRKLMGEDLVADYTRSQDSEEEIIVDDDRIVLKKYQPEDIFTGETDDLIEYHGLKVSKKSIEELAKIAGITK